MSTSSSSSSSEYLVVVLYGQRIGRLDREAKGDVSFTYDPEYLSRSARRPPLSMRLPLRPDRQLSKRVLPFLDGLLPENREVRRQKANARGVGDDPMSLLSVMGWDCPGAVQISPPDQVEEMLGRHGGLQPVTDAEIGERIVRLRDHTAGWTLPDEHWSLAGQQEKFALARFRRTDGSWEWAEAKGSAPTTHIVKPGTGRLRHQALVEHATTGAAGALGVSVADTEYVEFAGEPAIVIKRFDRIQVQNGSVQRIHQEDMAQATGRMPDSKYEENGGPTARDMAQILRNHAQRPQPELEKLADFVLINYATAAPDGHAKNVSIRILPDGDVRMAPLYDLASGLPYDTATLDRSLALAIGGERRFDRLHAGQWTRAARELGVPEDQLRNRARDLLAGFPDAFRDALDGVGTPEAKAVWNQAADNITDHTSACLQQLNAPSGPGRSDPATQSPARARSKARSAAQARVQSGGRARGKTSPANSRGSFRTPERAESQVDLD